MRKIHRGSLCCYTAAQLMLAVFVLATTAWAQYTPRNDYAAPLEPASSILHGAGQQVSESPGFHEYVDLMAEGDKPCIYMHYLSFVMNSDANMKSLLDIIRDYGLAGNYMGVQIGLNFAYDRAGDGGNSFADGLNDKAMLADFDHYRSINRPIWFRFGYECNGGWNSWAAANYRECFRRAALAMREKMPDAAAVWNIYPAAQSQSGYIEGWGNYHPGNTFIDWWSIDLFDNTDNLGSNTTNFLNAAASASRPVLIGEATPRYVGADNDGDWSGWFANHFSMFQNRAMVKGSAYINWNWTATRWPTWGNARLDTGSALVRNSYKAEMTDGIWQHAEAEADLRGAIGLAEVFVDAAATGAGDGSSWDNAFTSIAPAITALVDNYGRGILRVAQGTYAGEFSVPDGVRLFGGYPTGGGVDAQVDTYVTIIDGGSTGRCVTLSGRFSIVRGFTLQNGSANEGGGALISGADATLYRCVLKNNGASDLGGGAYISGDRARIAGCVIHENSATNGGGALYFENAADSLIYNSVVYENTAPTGAGIYVNGPALTLDSCTLAYHQGSGAAISTNYSGASLTTVLGAQNCIIAFNHPTTEQYAVRTETATTRFYLFNPLFYDNTNGGDYGGTGSEQIENALSGDPLFKNAGSGDFRLSTGSPAIDADTPPLHTWLAFDLRGLERGLDGNSDSTRGYDLGAYEYQSQTALTLDSAGGIWGFGGKAGPFEAARLGYTLYNHTNASLSWNLASKPEWLDADSAGGTLSSGQSHRVSFSFNDKARELAIGEHGAETILFQDLSNGTELSRRARLFIHYGGPWITQTHPAKNMATPYAQTVYVIFNEAVDGVDAADLTVNGSPATALTRTGTSTYGFSGFYLGESGQKTITLEAGGITSTATGKTFKGASWDFEYMETKTGIQSWLGFQ